MTIEPFLLERFFARHEFEAEHVLCASDCESMSVDELLSAEPGARERLLGLRLGYTESRGGPSLRAAISRRYGAISSDDVLVCSGAEEAIFLFMHAANGIVVETVQVGNPIGEIAIWNLIFCCQRKGHLVALYFVQLFERGREGFVVSLDWIKCFVWDSLGQKFGRCTKEAVADADVVVEEGERLAGFESLEPEAHAAEFGSHGIDIHAI